MGQYNKAIITAAGENLIARAVAGELKLNITKAKISNHRYPDGTDYKALTDMDGVKQILEYPETKVLDNNMIQTRVLFSNEEIQVAYYIQNIGLYAKDGEEEILFCIVTAVIPDEMPKYNGVASTSYIYNIQNVVQDAAEINIEVVPSGTATIQDVMERVDATGGDISETVIGTLESIDAKYPVPKVGDSTKVFMGKVKKYIEDAKPLDADIMVYVATTGCDTTGDGTSENPYKTITYALSQVPKVLGGYTATVNVADGIYNESVNIAGYKSGYLVIKRKGTQELNTLCNIKNIRAEFCGNISISGLNFTNTDGTSVYANVCEFIDIEFCQSIVATVSDETSFYFSCVSVGRIINCKSLNHDICLRSYLSNVISHNWVESLGKSYGILSEGGRVTSGNIFQPKGLITQSNDTIGGIIVSNFGARIGTLPADITLYVATTGSDITGDGSSANPYKTISFAINSLPRDFGGYNATIIVSAGTYNEDVLFLGYGVNGTLTITLAGNITVNSIYTENSNVIFRSSVVSVARTLSTKYMLITNASSINIYSDVYATTTGYYQDGSTRISIYIIRQSSAYFSGNTTITGNTDTAIAISNTSRAYFYSASGSGLGTGLSVSTGATLTIYSNNLSAVLPTAVWTGGQIINSNGTQISGLITSGLTCTWGTVTGGYIRHGNLNGVAMVTIQMSVKATIALNPGSYYRISGFPLPIGGNTAVTSTAQSWVDNCWLDASTGTINYTPRIELSSSSIYTILFNVTYLTNS